MPLRASTDLTPSGLATRIGECADALGLETFVLVGNDTGGAYAQVFAATAPERVIGLVLSNCDALGVFPPAQFGSLQTRIQIYADLTGLAFRSPSVLASR